MRYLMQYKTLQWNSKTLRNETVDITRRVPWLWVARIFVMVMKEQWFQGGSVIDTETGAVRITWELTGNVLSDGRVHIYEDGVDLNPPKLTESQIGAVLQHIAKQD